MLTFVDALLLIEHVLYQYIACVLFPFDATQTLPIALITFAILMDCFTMHSAADVLLRRSTGHSSGLGLCNSFKSVYTSSSGLVSLQ